MGTKYVGKSGGLEVPIDTEITGIKSWTLERAVGVEESTSFEDDGVKEFQGTTTEWSGSFEGYKSGAGAQQIALAGATTTIALHESDTPGTEWSGSCIVTGQSAASAYDGIVTYSYTFQGTGALTAPTV